MIHGTAAIALAVVMGVAPVEAPAPGALPLRPRRIEGPAPPPAPAEPEPAEPAMTTPVAPEPEPEPAPVVAQGPAPGPTVPVDEIPTPHDLRAPPPRWDGRGLLIGAGVMGVVNVGLAGARLGLSLGEVTADKEMARLILTAVATPIDLAAGIGLAAAGGYYRGRQSGYRSAYDLKPKNNARAFTGSGVTLLVMGVVAWISAWTPWQGDVTIDARGNGTLVVETLGSLLLMGGSGLVAYGVSWNKHTRLYGRSVRRVALRPAASPGFAGVRLSGRF